jgi:UDP-3-O-[3-hydroxymyristoyl] glucosamine N-acyltransferase
MFKSLSVAEIASSLSLSFTGENKIIKGFNTLKNATEDDLTFFSNSKYKQFLTETKAGACLIKDDDAQLLSDNTTKIICRNPYLAYAYVIDMLCVNDKVPGISTQACISKTAKLGDNCSVGPYTYIGDEVKIGKNATIGSNVTLTNCEIGDNCIIHHGVKIGQDGFGFVMDEKMQLKKIKQIGKVIIGHNVEIGANTCIDRGAIDNTYIGDNTKIDNLVQIGHNVVIGRNCIICGQVGIAGSASIGDYVMIGGQAGINGHISIGNMTQIAAQSGVVSDLNDGEKVGGTPAVKIMDWHKQTIFLKNAIKK